MSSSASDSPLRISTVGFTGDHITVSISDGRVLALPLAWYPRLENATPQQRGNWRLLGEGEGVHWTDLDEDLSLEGFLAGRPAAGSAEYRRRYRPGEYIALDEDLSETFQSGTQVNEALREYLRMKRETA